MTEDGGDRHSAANAKLSDAVGALRNHEGNRAVEDIFTNRWVALAVKMLAFWLTICLITGVGGTALTLGATVDETVKEVNQAAPYGKLIVFGFLGIIWLLLSWIFAISHHGRTPFYYCSAGLIIGLAINFLVTISPLLYRWANSILLN